jgi:hypothetical protein
MLKTRNRDPLQKNVHQERYQERVLLKVGAYNPSKQVFKPRSTERLETSKRATEHNDSYWRSNEDFISFHSPSDGIVKDSKFFANQRAGVHHCYVEKSSTSSRRR